MALSLLWSVYIVLHSFDMVPEVARGIVGLFIVIEFALILAGTVVTRRTHPNAEIAKRLATIQATLESMSNLGTEHQEMREQFRGIDRRFGEQLRVMRRVVERVGAVEKSLDAAMSQQRAAGYVERVRQERATNVTPLRPKRAGPDTD